MEKALKYLSLTDWLLSIGTLVVGAYLQNLYIIGAGVFGLLMAWYSPAKRIKAAMSKKFLRKTPQTRTDEVHVAADDAFYEKTDQKEPALAANFAPVSVGQSYAMPLGQGSIYLHVSPHNELRAAHLKLSAQPGSYSWT